MKAMILDTSVVTCPFGHVGEYRNNVIDEVYNENHHTWASKGQDRTFVQEMQIGDTVLIVFKKPVAPILARITSVVEYAYNTGYYTWVHDEVRHISRERADARVAENDVLFRPVCRKIEILEREVRVEGSWRMFGQGSLSKMSTEIRLMVRC